MSRVIGYVLRPRIAEGIETGISMNRGRTEGTRLDSVGWGTR
jgi:hypothetical protein